MESCQQQLSNGTTPELIERKVTDLWLNFTSQLCEKRGKVAQSRAVSLSRVAVGAISAPDLSPTCDSDLHKVGVGVGGRSRSFASASAPGVPVLWVDVGHCQLCVLE